MVLRKLGFTISNNLFANNSWYFRNALVRANYDSVGTGVHATMEYLNRFFGNLLLGQNNILKNREMQVKVGTVNDTVNVQSDTVNDAVFDIIKSNTKITANEIADELGIGIATVKRKIKDLKERGIIERIGSDKTGSWKIKGRV